MNNAPVTEDQCDRCRQHRPLFRYRPEPIRHTHPERVDTRGCAYCRRKEESGDPHLLLCVHCWERQSSVDEDYEDEIEDNADEGCPECDAALRDSSDKHGIRHE